MIEEMEDSSLRIFPESREESQDDEENELIIKVTKSRTDDEIIRLIIAAYLASKTKITLTNNFHNTEAAVVATEIGEGCYQINDSQYANARRRTCGIRGCQCSISYQDTYTDYEPGHVLFVTHEYVFGS